MAKKPANQPENMRRPVPVTASTRQLKAQKHEKMKFNARSQQRKKTSRLDVEGWEMVRNGLKPRNIAPQQLLEQQNKSQSTIGNRKP